MHRVEETESAGGVDLGGVLGHFERHRNVRLRTKIVNLIGFDRGKKLVEARAISQIAVV